jgi:hypothetical protein
VFSFVQALLGLFPAVPLKTLIVDPHLPPWLPEITLHDLRVGEATATIRFFRDSKGKSDYRVTDCRGPLHVYWQPSPSSLTATIGERVGDLLESFLPGR